MRRRPTIRPPGHIRDVSEGQARTGGGIGRVHFERALIYAACLRKCFRILGAMPVPMTSPQDKIVSLKVSGRTLRGSGGFTSADIRRKLGNDFRGQLALDGKDVGNLPVEAARPKVR